VSQGLSDAQWLRGRINRWSIGLHSKITAEDHQRAVSIAAKLERPAGLTWTTDKPTAPGWYWQRFTGSLPAVLYVYEDHEERLIVKFDIGNEPVDDLKKSEWAGPIPEPTAL
jgi:hypothetical protein